MKIIASSDFHGNLPPRVPECDLLLIAGDICPMINHDRDYQLRWLDINFRNWLTNAQDYAGSIVGIAGNHDFIFESRMAIDELHLPWVYLQDESTVWEDLSIHGIPWVPNLPAWAFHLDREGLKDRYDLIPAGTDIVLSHGPPYGYLDFTSPMYGNLHVGCKSATDMLHRVKPKVLICGHIHEGFGHRTFTGRNFKTEIYNVSFVDEHYVIRGSYMRTLIEIPSGDLMNDALQDENQADIERPIRGGDSDSRSSSEPVEGSEPC